MTVPEEGPSEDPQRRSSAETPAVPPSEQPDDAARLLTSDAPESTGTATPAAEPEDEKRRGARTDRGARTSRTARDARRTDRTRPEIPIRYSDSLRMYVASGVGVIVALVVLFPAMDAQVDRIGEFDSYASWLRSYLTTVAVEFYIFFWVAFSACYLIHTHLAYRGTPPPRLRAVAAAQLESERSSRLLRIMGMTGAANWSVSAAVVAVVLTVAIATSDTMGDDPRYIILGFATVAVSWLMMVYTYALRYMRLHASGERIDFEVEEELEFGEYLTMAVQISTMAATMGASIRSRAVWRAVREHTLLGFVFNTVIVAMTVSLLFGGVAG